MREPKLGVFVGAVMVLSILAGACSPASRPTPVAAPPSALGQIPTPAPAPASPPTPAQSPVHVPESSAPAIDDHSKVEQSDTNIDNNDTDLPLAGFIIEHTRSDPNRPVREYDEAYMGPIIDTHLHLDPPRSGNISESALKDIVESVHRAGVDSIVVMPVPNEGKLTYSSLGAAQRTMLRQLGANTIKIKYSVAVNISRTGYMIYIAMDTVRVS